ncbi:DNA internalization-related competence protein ComEC/Rec2 [bacterium]|nr:DNA internalization-related competence protein ComEC/Rec2 [bacterium]
MNPPGRATIIAAAVFTFGLLLAPDQSPSLWHLLLPVGALALAGIFLRLRNRVPQTLPFIALMVAFFSAGWLLGTPQPAPSIPEGRVWVQGTVRIPIERYDDRQRYRLSLHRWWAGDAGGELDLGAVLYLPDSLGVSMQPGEEVRLITRLERFRGPRNPGDIDWRGYWANRDVEVMLRSVRFVEPLGVQRFFGGWTRQVAGGWRTGMDTLIREYLTEPAQPLAQALLIGDRSHWDETLHDRIAMSGLMHLFAISGLHVGLMVLIAVSALSGLGFGPRITSLLALPLLWLLVPLTGANPPVVRAAIIISVAVVGRALQRNADPFHILALAYLLLLFPRPGGIHDPGFQLSFAGAAGSLYAGTYFRHLLSPTRKYARSFRRWLHRWSRRLLLAFVVSLYAWLFTAPVLVVHFGRIALLGPVATLPALVTVTLALTAGWVMVAVGWWPWLASVFGASMDVLLRATSGLADLANLHLPSLEYLPVSAAVLAGLVLLVVLISTRRMATQPFSGWLLTGLFAAVIVVYGSLWLPDSRVKLAVLDVGQGDAVLIRSGTHAVLIDSGPEYSTAVADQLRRLGIRELDLLLLSHGDADHCAAVPELLHQVKVNAALVSPVTSRDRAGQNAIHALRESGTDVRLAHAGLTVSGPWGELLCIYPPSPEIDPELPDNAQSLVWLWHAEEADAVFAGDAPVEVEHQLLRTLSLNEVELLMAGHHGSRSSTSREWLATLNPQVVAISCGRNNPHNHPSAELLERLHEQGAHVLRTDQSGAILFEVRDGELETINHSQWW